MPITQAELAALTPAQILRAAAQDARERAAQTVLAEQDRLYETAHVLGLEADQLDPPVRGPVLISYEILATDPDAPPIRLSTPVLCF